MDFMLPWTGRLPLLFPPTTSCRSTTLRIHAPTAVFGRFLHLPSLILFAGIAWAINSARCLGAHGWVAGLVDAFPRETVAIYKLVKAGRLEEAAKIYRWFMPLLELDIQSKLVQYIKLAAEKTGIGSEQVRAPRLPLIGEERERVLKIINTGLASRPVLPDYLNL